MDAAKELLLVIYKNVVFAFKMTTTNMYIGICKEISLQYMGAKKVVWDIQTCKGSRRISTNVGDFDPRESVGE